MGADKSEAEIIKKTIAKAMSKRSSRQAEKLAAKMERQACLTRMLEVPPKPDVGSPPGADKPSGVRMYLRAFRPQPCVTSGGYVMSEKATDYCICRSMTEVGHADQCPAEPKKSALDKMTLADRAKVVEAERGRLLALHKDNGSSQIGGGTHGGADEAAIYALHLPDHGDMKVYGTSPRGCFKKAEKYLSTYSRMLEDAMGQKPSGPPAVGPHGNYPKPPKNAEGLQVVNMGKENGQLRLK